MGARSARKTVRWTVFSGERAAAQGRKAPNRGKSIYPKGSKGATGKPPYIELNTPAIGSMTLSRIAPMTMESSATRVGSTMEIR